MAQLSTSASQYYPLLEQIFDYQPIAPWGNDKGEQILTRQVAFRSQYQLKKSNILKQLKNIKPNKKYKKNLFENQNQKDKENNANIFQNKKQLENIKKVHRRKRYVNISCHSISKKQSQCTGQINQLENYKSQRPHRSYCRKPEESSKKKLHLQERFKEIVWRKRIQQIVLNSKAKQQPKLPKIQICWF